MEHTASNYKEQAESILSKAIQMVAFHYNAYMPILSAFTVAYLDIVPTIGVDKYARLIVNPKFLVEHEGNAEGLLVHEILHVFMGHTTDTRSKLAYTDDAGTNKLINIAEDCAINQFISEPLPDGAVLPHTLQLLIHTNVDYNQDAEYYYELIQKYLEDNPGARNTLSGGMFMDATGDANTQDTQDKLDAMGIKHVSQEEINDRVTDTARAITKGKGQGSQYGALAEFARRLLEPKVDWRPLLRATLRNAEKKAWTIHERSTYKRISRRSQTVLMPKKYGHKVAVTLSFDTSGSITSDMVNQFLSEVQGCMLHSDVKECALWHTSNYWYGTPEQLMKNIDKVFKSGGTDEKCMGVAEKHMKADLHIHFSDGEHGTNYGFKEPHKNIEIVWQYNNIKEIRRNFAH